MERRTQAERSAATRKVLVDAAIGSLIEKGWAATTTVEVCRRTGLTRGALLHHFEDLPELLATALETLYRSPAEPAAVEGLVDLVDLTWARLSEPTFKAVLEAWLAAANDPALRERLAPVMAGFAKVVNPAELPWPDAVKGDERTTFYLTAREAMLGLALGRAISGGAALPHEARVLDRLQAEAQRIDGER